ncbi:MAG: hypothetical protein IKB11_02870 [Bacteroidaceae bacterium]|nr:hypothetical protein [Bacteroidaceae bacterium]
MKKQGNAETAARIDSLMQSMYNNSLAMEELNAIYMELDELKKEYDLFDVTFEEGGCKGVKDIAGKVRVPAIYKEYTELYSYTWGRKMPMAAVNGEGKCALVATDGTGMPMCGFEYNNIEFMFASDGYYRCEKEIDGKTKFGILNAQGELLVPCEMDVVHAVSNNFSGIVKDGKIGIITISGVYIAPVFDDLEEDGEFVKACKDGKWGYLGSKGEFVDMDDEENVDEVELLCLFDF